MSTIFNTDSDIDFTKQHMFFGPELNTQRFDRFRFPIFDKQTQNQLEFFWRPEEVALQKDISDFKSLNEHEKRMYNLNLSFQTLLDSIVGRSPFQAFLPIVSLPELENCITTWGFFEAAIHSRSYTHIIKNVYPDPSVIFDKILLTPEILERAKFISKIYDDLIEGVRRYKMGLKVDVRELKKLLYLAIVATNALEGVRFYTSFACSFALAENKLMEGSAKILSLITRDENVHVAITTAIINNWRTGKDDPEFLEIIKECEADAVRIFVDTVEQEKEWAEFLFKDGSIIGLNAKLLSQYVEYMGAKRAKGIGLKLPYDAPKENPLPWMEHWINSSSVQAARMETENEAYLQGAIKQDITADTFGGFEL